MVLSRPAKIGLAVIAIGLLPMIVFFVWYAHIKTVPVDKPISLSVGHIREPFSLNFTSSDYRMGIEVERKLPHETLQCLLGIKDYVPEGQCKSIPPVLHFNWTLTQNGRILESGSSDSILGGAYTDATVENQFGSFDGKRGQRYVLDLNILQDGSALSVAKPKLVIGVSGFVNEDLAVGGLITLAWALFWCFTGALIWLILLIAARRKKKGTVTAV